MIQKKHYSGLTSREYVDTGGEDTQNTRAEPVELVGLLLV